MSILKINVTTLFNFKIKKHFRDLFFVFIKLLKLHSYMVKGRTGGSSAKSIGMVHLIRKIKIRKR